MCALTACSRPEANRKKTGNIETGEEIRTLRGHSRGIRALQFDDSKLISGSLDSEFAAGTCG
jgi:hypothetical protein